MRPNNSNLPTLSNKSQRWAAKHGCPLETVDKVIRWVNRKLPERRLTSQANPKSNTSFQRLLIELDPIVGGPISTSIFDWRLTSTPWCSGLSRYGFYQARVYLDDHTDQWTSKEEFVASAGKLNKDQIKKLPKAVREWVGVTDLTRHEKLGMPPRMHKKRDSFFYVIPLGKDITAARDAYAQCESQRQAIEDLPSASKAKALDDESVRRIIDGTSWTERASKFLSTDELSELTGCKRPTRQIKWLKENDWLYSVNTRQIPSVTHEYFVRRLVIGEPNNVPSTTSP